MGISAHRADIYLRYVKFFILESSFLPFFVKLCVDALEETIAKYGLLQHRATETGCGMNLNKERFRTYKSPSPVLRTQTTCFIP